MATQPSILQEQLNWIMDNTEQTTWHEDRKEEAQQPLTNYIPQSFHCNKAFTPDHYIKYLPYDHSDNYDQTDASIIKQEYKE